MIEQPLPRPAALRAMAASAGTTAALLVRCSLHMPGVWVAHRLSFADGTSAGIYRETTVDRTAVAEPAVLVVQFRLRGVRGRRGHAVFRAESILNTPLFAGFPGFVSKLWLAHDEHGTYRGVYQWDGADRAIAYVRALWWALAAVSDTRSIRYRIVPGVWRDAVLREPDLAGPASTGEAYWWQPTAVA